MDKTLPETIYVYISLWLFRRLPFLLDSSLEYRIHYPARRLERIVVFDALLSYRATS